ncbi:MAG TPA: HEPN domain-containing protein [Longimicrobium sp.]|jgi:HEPN domain-containing protein
MTSPSEIQILVVKQWVELGREDLAWAETGAENRSLPGPGKIGFHAQQAVEKLLKGLLTTYSVDPEDQHNLGRLIEQLRRLDRATGDAAAPSSQPTPYAVIYRYPPRNPLRSRQPTRDDALHALQIARDACATLGAAIEKRLRLLQERAEPD